MPAMKDCPLDVMMVGLHHVALLRIQISSRTYLLNRLAAAAAAENVDKELAVSVVYIKS